MKTLFRTRALLILLLLTLPVQSEDTSEPIMVLDFAPTDGTTYSVRVTRDGYELKRVETERWWLDERDFMYQLPTNAFYQVTITPVVLGEEVSVLRTTNDYYYKITNEVVIPLPDLPPSAPKGVTIKD